LLTIGIKKIDKPMVNRSVGNNKMLFVCVRCSRQVSNEEQYMLFRGHYCRACIDSKMNDPSELFEFNYAMRDLIQIES